MKKFLGWWFSHLWRGAVGCFHLFMSLPSWRWKTAVAIPLMFLMALPVCYVFHPDFGTYSEGVRMGNMHDWSQNQEHWYSLINTYEGKMYLGNQSTPWTNPATGKEENPWEYSSTYAAMIKYRPSSLGKYVVVHYRQVWLRLNLWNGDTDYRVVSVELVDPTLAPQSCGNVDPHAGFMDSKGGPFSGRMVKVSWKGNFAKSWEVLIQKGDSGNGFEPLSILNNKIAACATLFARSGVPVTIYYEKSRIVNPLTQDTYYNIVGLARSETNHL